MDIHAARALLSILVRKVEELLIIGIGMDRVHKAMHDAEFSMEHLGQRRQAVRGAGCVRDDVVFGWIMSVLVTRITNVASGPLAGAEMRTFFAPAVMCLPGSPCPEKGQ